MSGKSNKGAEFILIGSALVILAFIYFGSQFFIVNVAYSPSTILQTGINTAVYSSDDTLIVFGQYQNLYHEPNHAMNFFTRGDRWTIKEEEEIYTIPRWSNGLPQLLTTIIPPHNEHLNYGDCEILALEKNDVYLKVRYTDSNKINGQRVDYSFNTATHHLTKLSEEEAADIEKQYYGQKRFEVQNANVWIGYKKDVGLAEITGKLLWDQRTHQVVKSGSNPTVVKLLLDQTVLSGFLPRADHVLTIDDF